MSGNVLFHLVLTLNMFNISSIKGKDNKQRYRAAAPFSDTVHFESVISLVTAQLVKSGILCGSECRLYFNSQMAILRFFLVVCFEAAAEIFSPGINDDYHNFAGTLFFVPNVDNFHRRGKKAAEIQIMKICL